MTKKAGKASKKQGIRKLSNAHRLQDSFTEADHLRQILMPLVTGAAEARRGLMQWTQQVGLEALQRIFLDDAEGIAGPKGKHVPDRTHHHWGSTSTTLEFGGRRVSRARESGSARAAR